MASLWLAPIVAAIITGWNLCHTDVAPALGQAVLRFPGAGRAGGWRRVVVVAGGCILAGGLRPEREQLQLFGSAGTPYPTQCPPHGRRGA